jgi:hypothetical protein
MSIPDFTPGTVPPMVDPTPPLPGQDPMPTPPETVPNAPPPPGEIPPGFPGWVPLPSDQPSPLFER